MQPLPESFNVGGDVKEAIGGGEKGVIRGDDNSRSGLSESQEPWWEKRRVKGGAGNEAAGMEIDN
jgi:hypothetical protein